jgi:hypothetical protein
MVRIDCNLLLDHRLTDLLCRSCNSLLDTGWDHLGFANSRSGPPDLGQEDSRVARSDGLSRRGEESMNMARSREALYQDTDRAPLKHVMSINMQSKARERIS